MFLYVAKGNIVHFFSLLQGVPWCEYTPIGLFTLLSLSTSSLFSCLLIAHFYVYILVHGNHNVH